MRLLSFRHADVESWGALLDDSRVVDLGAGDQSHSTLLQALEAGAVDTLDSRAFDDRPTIPVDDITFLPVLPSAQRIFCVGLNYEDHRIETGRDPSARPTIFTRFASAQVGHGCALVKPKVSDQFDYEGELAVVIGRAGRYVSERAALDHVVGYSCFLDGSVRDWQRHTTQFTPGKNFDASGGFGPCLVTSDEIPDPTALRLVTRVNGEVMQDTTTDLMIFSVVELVVYLSTFTELRPGDVIATGTPGGVGSRREPPMFLGPGDEVEVEISEVGTLRHPIVAEEG